jgi:non-specific serine/threonine protein kinase
VRTERQPSDIALSLDRGCLLRDGREIRLRAKTFQVLVYLHQHQGRLVAKEDLFRAVWRDTFVSDDSLTKCIREIREALGDRDRQLLKTVARRGFILDAPLAAREQRAEPQSGPTPGQSERRTHNLPAPLTSFIGRQREIAELVGRVRTTRLLTLTGAGGCGKTRLALAVARRMSPSFPDGVWLADLSPLTEPGLVAQTVASALDIRQAPSRSIVETLADRLRNRKLLLLLDNCEHVIASSAELAETLLREAEGLTILATSREALGIAGETTWRVPSLALPQPDQTGPARDLLQYEAVHLLAERAAAVASGFVVTDDNAGIVAEVCRRLDGIPLAIELAAARVNVLSIEQINARLDDRFRLLGARTSRSTVGRQRTLEAAVDWSYDLLPEPERQMLRRLSVFAGGWTLEAAEHVCASEGIDRADVLDVMSRLVDKSLVMADEEAEGRRRYRYLETVRQYGLERLRQSGEADAVHARHFAYFLDLTRRAEPELTRAEQLRWLGLLRLEHDNLRAALEWRLSSDRPGPEALALATPLHWFWLKHAYLAEGQRWLERAIAGSVVPPAARRAAAHAARAAPPRRPPDEPKRSRRSATSPSFSANSTARGVCWRKARRWRVPPVNSPSRGSRSECSPWWHSRPEIARSRRGWRRNVRQPLSQRANPGSNVSRSRTSATTRCARATSIEPGRCTNGRSAWFARMAISGQSGLSRSISRCSGSCSAVTRRPGPCARRRSSSGGSSAIAAPSPGPSVRWPARMQPKDTSCEPHGCGARWRRCSTASPPPCSHHSTN